MSVDLIRKRLDQATPESAQQEDQLLREIMQEIALSALSRTGFFKVGAFHGGSSLRILHGLNRFSELC